MKSFSLSHKNVNTEETVTKSKFKRVLIALSVLLTIAAAVGLFFLRGWIFMNPFSSIEFESISEITTDSAGNIYLVYDATTSILKVSPDGELMDKINVGRLGVSAAQHITIGGDGRLYIHDVLIDKGVRIQEEGIVSVDTDFDHATLVNSSVINGSKVRQTYGGMSPSASGIFFFKKESFAITVFNESGSRIKTLPFSHPDDSVMYIASDAAGENIFYVTYNGEVRRYVDGENDDVIYDSDQVDGSIPEYISYKDGMLYVTDIGLRDLIMIDTASGSVDRREVEDAYEDRVIHLVVSSDNELVTASSYSYIVWGEDSYDEIWEITKSSRVTFFCVLTWACLIWLWLFTIALVMQLLWKLLIKATVFIKTGAAILFGVIVVVGLLLGTLFPEFTDQLTDQIFEKAMLAASVTNENLPEDSFLALSKPSDFMNEDYKKVQHAVQSIFLSENNNSEELYCVLYRVIDGTVTLTYTLEDICVVYPYDWEYEGTELQEVLEGGEVIKEKSITSSGSYIMVYYPLTDEDGNTIGIAEVGTDLDSVTRQNKKIMISLLINVIAMTIVVVMFVIELMYFVRGRREYTERIKTVDKSKANLTPEIFRLIVFLIFFFTNLTCVILPLQAKHIAMKHPNGVLSAAMMAAIPVSAEVFSGAIFSMLGSKVLRWLGAKRTILVSSLLFTAGLGLRIIPSIWMLTLGSVLLGAGWGLLLILVNVQIAELPEEEKDRGYAYYSISSTTGANCAIMLGGFMLQFCSYTTVFTITAACSVILYFVCRKYLANNVPDQTEEVAEESNSKESPIRFFFRPRVISFFILILIPLLICGYFLNYMFPILGDEWGMSETFIGYAFMITGICAVILGTPLTTFFTRRDRRHVGLFLTAICYGIAFVTVGFLQSIPALLIAITVIGIGDSFGIPLYSSYFTELPEVERFGYDRAFGVYSLVENGAQSLGAFVLGFVYDIGITTGMYGLVAVITVFALIFLITASIGRLRLRKKEKQA